MKNLKLVKDENAREIADQYGYAVEITNSDLDSAVPVFHRYGSHSPLTELAPRIIIPAVHAVRFAIPCNECYPTPGEI